MSSSFEELDIVVQWMNKHPSQFVQLSGHTDDVGGERFNLLLSRNRAKAVSDYLISQGVPAKRIESFGYGRSRPIAKGISEEARRLNRRVEIKFVN